MISALEETSTNLIGSASKTASIARKATLLEDLTSQIKLQEELELRLRDAQTKEATEEEAELAALEHDPEIKELRAKLAQGLERNKKLQSSSPATNDIVDKGTRPAYSRTWMAVHTGCTIKQRRQRAAWPSSSLLVAATHIAFGLVNPIAPPPGSTMTQSLSAMRCARSARRQPCPLFKDRMSPTGTRLGGS